MRYENEMHYDDVIYWVVRALVWFLEIDLMCNRSTGLYSAVPHKYRLNFDCVIFKMVKFSISYSHVAS